jgi:hypothetical protein
MNPLDLVIRVALELGLGELLSRALSDVDCVK